MASQVYKVVPRIQLPDSVVAMNVYYWMTPDAQGAESDRKDELAARVNSLYDLVDTYMSNDADFLDIQITNLTELTPTTVHPWPTLTSGGAVGTALPPGVAFLITAGTTVLKVYARKYLPGFTEAVWEFGTWSATLLTAGAAFGAYWLSGFTGGTTGTVWVPCVLRSAGNIAYFINLFVRSEPGYQRRRREGSGI